MVALAAGLWAGVHDSAPGQGAGVPGVWTVAGDRAGLRARLCPCTVPGGRNRLGKPYRPARVPSPVLVPVRAVPAAGRANEVRVGRDARVHSNSPGGAQADNVPLVLISGRTPLTEHDRLGARATAIQYGQEIFDQTALVREITKYN